MSSPFTKFPTSSSTTIHPKPFKVDIPKSTLEELKILLKLSKLAPPTYENSQQDRRYGVTGEWIREAKDKWLNDFEWSKHEAYINSFPHYTAPVVDDSGKEHSLHFLALYSEKPDAVPIVMLHGWPGSFLEFLPILDLLKNKYTPATLPYHIIVPSLPGFAFSSLPLDQAFKLENIAEVVDKLMIGLGFGAGYVSQGGDVGYFVAKVLAVSHPSCKAYHVNMYATAPPDGFDYATLNEPERQALERGSKWRSTGIAYGITHATRPSTIGFVIASNPLALLAWVGEKYLEWSDEDPPLDTILAAVTLYWVTETFPRSIYVYGQLMTSTPHESISSRSDKPLGYSWFPREMVPIPKSWAAASGNLVFFKQHSKGGHFAALENPDVLLGDVEEFVAQVWPGASK
ncbi:hypothetical protein BOTBODRAFT_43065 [Botryobasidium botryosum FD-172 SS1]|uniref:Epoxide hydrolase N-terminal domain-containing protein n=1 Tax=Botryobasidium botryosum (strain FD-172 SS1) TaxID=930990 RepID=A0A067MYD8_BOTB1|nr:hypothetical protein BOTBODRAFT_43065 [Botryobasidium botryosum FD-172 SS1]